MARLFGTDGVRGVAGTELDGALAYDLGRAGAYVLSRNAKRPKILIGRDTRISGEMLEAALAAGVCAVGGDVLLCGVMPTPAVAWLTRHIGADAGVMISASHNPMEYNGIKFFNGNGYKLADEVEDTIESVINSRETLPTPIGGEMGRIRFYDTAIEEYSKYVERLTYLNLKGMRIMVDCAHGASGAVAPRVLRELGALVVEINNDPDGVNINDQCGSTHLETLSAAVKADGKIDVGFAFDGDADRMLAVDGNGEEVDGDQIMAICAVDLKARGLLANDTLVVTVMSNLGLKIAMKENQINLEETKVGDRYVLERMLQGGFCLGGEQSGHLIFSQHNTTGDGLISALMLLKVMKNRNKPLHELKNIMKKLPQVLVNLTLESNDQKALWDQDGEVLAAIEGLEQSYDGRGRVLVRASGTEPLIRVMIEGEEKSRIAQDAQELKELIARKLQA